MQNRKKKRDVRILRERKRYGTEKQGRGWASRQAAKHGNMGKATSVRKTPKKRNRFT